MPFEFRLAVPLRLARARRDGHRKELAILLRAVMAAEKALRLGEESLTRIGNEIARRAAQGVPGDELAQMSGQRDLASLRLPDLRERLAHAVERETAVREELAHATREVTVLEKLRREQFVEYRRELARKEQRMIDDVLVTRRARAMLESNDLEAHDLDLELELTR